VNLAPFRSPQFNFDDESVFTCIGTSGKEPLAQPSPILTRRQQQALGAAAGGWPAAQPQPRAPPSNVDPDQAAEAFMSALKNMLSNMGGQQPGPRQ
jgi:hypothetical protein